MYLTEEEEKALGGELGPVKQKAMEILVALGDIFGAEKMIPVGSAQVAGVSYTSLGDAGIEWIESLSAERVSVPTTLNPAGMDLDLWEEMKVPREFAEKQLRIIDAYRRLGVMTICSCTPYLFGNVPRFGEHIAWSESSAVCFANSVLGARSNREGGPSALASAIIGKTPCYGYHLDENRRPTLRVRVLAELRDESDFGCLGYWVGKIAKTGVPYFSNIKAPRRDDLKALGAGLATSGGVALYHVEDVTPESGHLSDAGIDVVKFDANELKQCYEDLTTERTEEVDLVCFGCPHASIEEIRRVSEILDNRKVSTKLWLFASVGVKKIAERCGYLDVIRRAGGEIYSDCCMVVAPLRDMGVKTIAVNSAKAALYAPTTSKVNVVFGTLEKCTNIALRGNR